jgi:hypothetical protein
MATKFFPIFGNHSPSETANTPEDMNPQFSLIVWEKSRIEEDCNISPYVSHRNCEKYDL